MRVQRLYTRIYWHFLGVLLVVGLTTSAIFASGWRAAFVRGAAERVARHAATLVAEHWDEPARRAHLVARFAEELDVDVTVRGPGGERLEAAGPELPVLAGEEAERVRAAPAFLRRGRGWFVAAPVRRLDGTLVGILEVSPVRRFRGPSLWRPIATVALVLGIVGIATVPLARRISRPVERLTEASRRLGAGDLSYRVPIDGDCPPHGRRRGPPWVRHHRDELDGLVRAWNDMAERVERLVRGQKELLANVSHELRSPLARIRVALELVPRETQNAARLQDVETDLSELDRLIEDVLITSRLEATRLPTHLGPVEARALLAQLRDRALHDPAVAGREVRLEDGPPVALVADGALLKRALWNLVENAAKYGAPPITLGAERRGGRVALLVTDQGSGIAPADRDRVLAPFYRGDKAHTPSGPGEPSRGFGLGLTLARRVAEVHGGSIRIGPARTADGQESGCRITLEVPLAPASGEADDAPAPVTPLLG